MRSGLSTKPVTNSANDEKEGSSSWTFNDRRLFPQRRKDGWLDSGDRAYLATGDVFVTGRVKDIIIRAGRHLYPQEIEEAVAGIRGIRKGGVAVFGAPDRTSGTERVIVLAETCETDPLCARRCRRAYSRYRPTSPARRPTKSYWRHHARCQRHRAARSVAVLQKRFTREDVSDRYRALCGCSYHA
jgi:acyl-CoA synthetase (AMP-forming)/AMP-acid ligase II